MDLRCCFLFTSGIKGKNIGCEREKVLIRRFFSFLFFLKTLCLESGSHPFSALLGNWPEVGKVVLVKKQTLT